MTTRTLVLDEDGLDLLELALSDAIPRLPMPVTAAGREGDLVLTDAENTPLARLPALVPLRPRRRPCSPSPDTAARTGTRSCGSRLPHPASGWGPWPAAVRSWAW